MKEIDIQYDLFKKPAFLLVSISLFLVPYARIDFQECYARASEFTAGLTFNKFMFTIILNKFFFALLGLGLLIKLLQVFRSGLGLGKMTFTFQSILRLQGSLIIVALTSTAIYLLISAVFGSLLSPIDLGLDTDSGEAASIMLSQFTFLTCLGLLLGNVNVINSTIRQRKQRLNGAYVIEAYSSLGPVSLPPEQVTHFEKVGRQYWVYTPENAYRVKTNLTALETLLKDRGFFRANRATLVNKAFIDEVTFWEFDKYILRLKNDKKTEMVISRQKWRLLKGDLEKEAATQPGVSTPG